MVDLDGADGWRLGSRRRLGRAQTKQREEAQNVLAHRLELQHARIHRVPGKMAGEDGVVWSDPARAGEHLTLEVHTGDAVHHEERIPVRDEAFDRAPVETQID